uniref:Uncharacterized protein LOC100186103 n=1 Tax=Phallusia mammillata TaxID=59560 RepID=A0A6F9DIF2_9ASCI|nr:uncharacterized protein LOC100186103 [Phallusia mammillata]
MKHIIYICVLCFLLNFIIPTTETFCDDGQTNIEIDLHGESDWKCLKTSWSLNNITKSPPSKKCYPLQGGSHVCIDNVIDSLYPKDVIPNSGPHRTVWAVYGEHKYVPPGRFVHNLEHGGVVFLYHPCAPVHLIETLRNVAKTCTWKHVFAAYRNLTQEFPLAVLMYGCVYKMNRINSTDISNWVRARAKKSPEDDNRQGGYNHSLIELSLPPVIHEKQEFCPAVPEPTPTPTPTPRTDEAIWAVGSLVFICAILIAAVCYTKLWRSKPGYDNSGAKLWHDGNAGGSMSVAAVVRKLPHMMKSKMKNTRSAASSSFYTRIEDNLSSSEEEL